MTKSSSSSNNSSSSNSDEVSSSSAADEPHSNTAATTDWKSIYIIAVVAFITAVESVSRNEWNYFCQLNSSATITFFGILRTAGGISAGFSTMLAGWLCNKLRNTRQVLLVSKVLILVAGCIYLAVELVASHDFLFYAFFLCFKVLAGIANGGGGMTRTHVAMGSTEGDRAKAIALTTLLPSIGLLAGSFLNIGTSFLQYPGPQIPLLGIHLNMFTAPALFHMLVFCCAFYLLLCHFDGKWYNYERMERGKSVLEAGVKSNENQGINGSGGWTDMEQIKKTDSRLAPKSWERMRSQIASKSWERMRSQLVSTTVSIPSTQSAAGRLQHKLFSKLFADSFPSGDQFDWLAVTVCLFTQMAVSFSWLNLMTISVPFEMLAFEWSAAELQLYGSLIGVGLSVLMITVPAVYMFFGLNKIITERNAVIFGLGWLISFYLFTYSWPFLGETFHYASQHSPFNPISNSSGNATLPVSNCGSHSRPGCPSHYQWCGTTTKPNIIVYVLSFTLAIGMAVPILRMNMDILYSKMLGNIKQGVMQGLFFSCQLLLEMTGTQIMLSWVFERTGPRYIWQFVGGWLAVCLLLWLLFHKRMVANTECRRLGTRPRSK